MAAPLVTIGIPTLNRSAYLLTALHSALAQGYLNVEVVVSDNASSDDTVQLVSELTDPRIKLLRQPQNIGLIPNFNACLAAATGEFFLMLSDDDVLEPAAIEKLVLPFLQGAHGLSPDSIGITWCACDIINSDGASIWTTSSGPAHESSVSMMTALFSGTRGPRLASVLLRTQDARSVGSYSHRFGDLCDTSNWGQVALAYPNVVCIQQPLVKYRMHAKAGTAAKNVTAEQKPPAKGNVSGETKAASNAVSAKCAIWQQWGDNMLNDCIAVVQKRGDADGVRRLQAVRPRLLANLTVDVLMRGKGQQGWIGIFASEFWRSRSFMLTPYVARRVVRDGWKLLRLK